MKLIALAEARRLSLAALVSEIDQQRPGPGNLSSALRLACSRDPEAEDQSSLNPFWRTKAPKSARSGTEYCRALSSDQP